ncbi:MAG: hypothetical protein ACK4K0_04015 [Flavobacteriales bacterium]
MNEKISIENYEAFMLDYIEGRLNAEQEIVLFEFLAQHPELEVDFDMALPVLSKEQVKFEQKAALIRGGINIENRSYYFIAFQENQLTEIERQEVLRFVADNSQFEKEFNQYQKSVFEKEIILFPNRSELLVKAPRVIPIWAYSAAASVVLLIGSFLFLNQENGMYLPRTDTNEMSYTDLSEDIIKFNYAQSKNVGVHLINKPLNYLPKKNESQGVVSSTAVNDKKIRHVSKRGISSVTTQVNSVELPKKIDLPRVTDEQLAFNQPESKKDVLTIPEFLALKTREIIGVESPNPTIRIEENDVQSVFAYSYQKITGKESPIIKAETEETKTTGFKLGTFEYKRIVAKK